MTSSESSISKLIDQSSLGSQDAKRARACVPLPTGQALARSAMTGARSARLRKPETSSRAGKG